MNVPRSASILFGLLLAGSIPVLAGCSRECKPMETEAEARQALKTLLIKEKKNFPSSFNIIDLDEQITNVVVLGPQMTFDPPGRRYIRFHFDTACGAIVQPNAIVDECGRIVNLTPWDNVCAAASNNGEAKSK